MVLPFLYVTQLAPIGNNCIALFNHPVPSASIYPYFGYFIKVSSVKQDVFNMMCP